MFQEVWIIWFISINEKKLVRAFEGHSGSVSFPPNNEFIVSGSKNGMICLWSIKEKKMLHAFKAHRDEIASTLFSPNGEYIISGSWDCTVNL